jgi:hypothetical protein
LILKKSALSPAQKAELWLVSCGKWRLSTAQEQIFQASALLKAVKARIAKFSPRSRIFGFEWFESFFNKLVMNYQIKI